MEPFAKLVRKGAHLCGGNIGQTNLGGIIFRAGTHGTHQRPALGKAEFYQFDLRAQGIDGIHNIIEMSPAKQRINIFLTNKIPESR